MFISKYRMTHFESEKQKIYALHVCISLLISITENFDLHNKNYFNVDFFDFHSSGCAFF